MGATISLLTRRGKLLLTSEETIYFEKVFRKTSYDSYPAKRRGIGLISPREQRNAKNIPFINVPFSLFLSN